MMFYTRLCCHTVCKVLKIAHDVLAAGHLGMTKTKNRILRYFYWPNIYKDIIKYVRSYDVCVSGLLAKHIKHQCVNLQ